MDMLYPELVMDTTEATTEKDLYMKLSESQRSNLVKISHGDYFGYVGEIYQGVAYYSNAITIRVPAPGYMPTCSEELDQEDKSGDHDFVEEFKKKMVEDDRYHMYGSICIVNSVPDSNWPKPIDYRVDNSLLAIKFNQLRMSYELTYLSRKYVEYQLNDVIEDREDASEECLRVWIPLQNGTVHVLETINSVFNDKTPFIRRFEDEFYRRMSKDKRYTTSSLMGQTLGIQTEDGSYVKIKYDEGQIILEDFCIKGQSFVKEEGTKDVLGSLQFGHHHVFEAIKKLLPEITVPGEEFIEEFKSSFFAMAETQFVPCACYNDIFYVFKHEDFNFQGRDGARDCMMIEIYEGNDWCRCTWVSEEVMATHIDKCNADDHIDRYVLPTMHPARMVLYSSACIFGDNMLKLLDDIYMFCGVSKPSSRVHDRDDRDEDDVDAPNKRIRMGRIQELEVHNDRDDDDDDDVPNKRIRRGRIETSDSACEMVY
jgi:hypothetical protein